MAQVLTEHSKEQFIQTLSGDAGTYHAGFPTIQRVARGAGDRLHHQTS